MQDIKHRKKPNFRVNRQFSDPWVFSRLPKVFAAIIAVVLCAISGALVFKSLPLTSIVVRRLEYFLYAEIDQCPAYIVHAEIPKRPLDTGDEGLFGS